MRALGVGLPYALANAMFGGTAEYVALSLKSAGHERCSVWYVAGMSAITLVASLLMPDTRIWGYLDGTGHVEDAPVPGRDPTTLAGLVLPSDCAMLFSRPRRARPRRPRE